MSLSNNETERTEPTACQNHHETKPQTNQLSCSYFRSMVQKITSITDVEILDKIERLHIECKNCDVSLFDQKSCTTEEETQCSYDLGSDKPATIGQSSNQIEHKSSEPLHESKNSIHL